MDLRPACLCSKDSCARSVPVHLAPQPLPQTPPETRVASWWHVYTPLLFCFCYTGVCTVYTSRITLAGRACATAWPPHTRPCLGVASTRAGESHAEAQARARTHLEHCGEIVRVARGQTPRERRRRPWCLEGCARDAICGFSRCRQQRVAACKRADDTSVPTQACTVHTGELASCSTLRL